MNFLRRLSPARVLTLGFLTVIFSFSFVLMLPACLADGVQLSYIDSLYTCFSAVCVTGLVTVDPGTTFSPLGQLCIGLMMQFGGLGLATVSAGAILMVGGRVSLRERTLLREAMNTGTGRGLVILVYEIFIITIGCELVGTMLCYPVFRQDYPPLRALGVSLFHTVASFNNAGFDILGHADNLASYHNSLWLYAVTSLEIVLGGIGFLVLREMRMKHFRWKRLSMHARVVLATSATLIPVGALLLMVTEDISLTDALFHSVSARTAGFSTVDLSKLSSAGLLVIEMLMIIGASPGSTGGGLKTSTFFVLLSGMKSAATNRSEKAFHYSLPPDAFRKAAIVTAMGLLLVVSATWLLLALEPSLYLRDAMFEMISAFGTVGLSTGITASLHTPAKLLSMLLMFVGRLGPMTIATLWYFDRGERVRYPFGNISIG